MPATGVLVVVELEPCAVVRIPEEGPAGDEHVRHRGAEAQRPVQLPPGLVLREQLL